jgi:hypothetical protein
MESFMQGPCKNITIENKIIIAYFLFPSLEEKSRYVTTIHNYFLNTSDTLQFDVQ